MIDIDKGDYYTSFIRVGLVTWPTAGAIAYSDVTHLYDEIWDNTVNVRVFETECFLFT